MTTIYFTTKDRTGKFFFGNMCGVNKRGVRTQVTVNAKGETTIFSREVPGSAVLVDVQCGPNEAPAILDNLGIDMPFDYATMQVI